MVLFSARNEPQYSLLFRLMSSAIFAMRTPISNREFAPTQVAAAATLGCAERSCRAHRQVP